MKRFLTLLAAFCLCLPLAACHRYLPENNGEPKPEPDPVVDPGVPADEPMHIDALNVEFAVGGRDVSGLLALQQAFPDELRDALGRQLVEVDEVNVTFGTSGEATLTAMQNGAVQLAFLPAEDYYPYGGGTIVAAELALVPDLALGLLVSDGKDGFFDNALRDALSNLEAVLAPYTGPEAGGVYVYDTALLEQMQRLYETGDAVLLTKSAAVGGKELTLRGVGHRLNDYLWGIRAIEVYDGETLLQTIEMTEAADDPDGGLEEYTECPEPQLLLRAVDANFDGYDDIEVFGWMPNNTVPYFYWLWDAGAKQYAYRFRLQGPTIDPETETLSAEYRESAAASWKDVYQWRDGELVLLSHEPMNG